MFFKGALLRDPKKVLVQPGKNTQSARSIRFTDVKQIKKCESVLKAYINEAISVEKDGRRVEFKKTSDFTIPEELQKYLDKDRSLRVAWETLTPGRQRGYILHFASAKQSKTRETRIEKSKKRIIEGKGLNDR